MRQAKFKKLLLSMLFIYTLFIIGPSRAFAEESSTIGEVRGYIKDFYVDQVSQDILNMSSIKDMVDALHDPYTQYFTAEEYDSFTGSINNNVVGIGVRIELVNEGVKILSFGIDSPAEKAGIKPGDIIVQVNGTDLSGVEDPTEYIKGEAGTNVTLMVKRGDEYLVFTVTRKEVHFPSVEGKILEGNVGYISISSFAEKTPEEFYSTYLKLKRYNPEGYIIDLRNNPGGYLVSALRLSGYFIGNKPALITEDRIEGRTTYYSYDYKETIKKPMAFLVNEYSASASEVLSSSVKDYNKALFIGRRTFGKGLVQAPFPLSDGGILKLTIQRFYSPLGKTINKTGIQPNVEVGIDDNIDELNIAKLLYAAEDKSGNNVLVSIGGRCFRIPAAIAAKEENYETFKFILQRAEGVSYEGKSADILKIESLPLYYKPGISHLSDINAAPVDKKFKVQFNTEVKMDTVNSSSIELIETKSGEKLPLNFKKLDEKTFEVVPNGGLETGHEYYLIINDTIEAKSGEKLSEKAVLKVRCGNK